MSANTARVGACATFCLRCKRNRSQERGKRVVNECLDALGGQRYLDMQNREVAGRAYSFYREKLSGLGIAKIYTRFYPEVKDTAHDLA